MKEFSEYSSPDEIIIDLCKHTPYELLDIIKYQFDIWTDLSKADIIAKNSVVCMLALNIIQYRLKCISESTIRNALSTGSYDVDDFQEVLQTMIKWNGESDENKS